MEAKFITFDNSSNWVRGEIGDYIFHAKLFDEPSVFGIKNGRVSKLQIANESGTIVNYDRGWDKRPKGKEINDIFNAVMNLCENSPKRFENETSI